MKAIEFFNTQEGKKYLDMFQGETFVLKYGGAALETPEMMGYFLEDVAEMKKHGINIVLVHGGGKRLSARMKEEKLPVTFENGLRQTSPEAAILAQKVFSELNKEVCQKLSEYGCQSTPLDQGRTIAARLIDPEKPHNRVGVVHEVHSDLINTANIPVISSVGCSVGPPVDEIEEGSLLNINADWMAVDVALAIRARKVIFISDVNGIYTDHNDSSTKLSHVTEGEIASLVERGILHGGMELKVNMALQALKGGVNKVHFIDGSIEHSLILEIFTDQGVGTEIVHNE